MTFAHLLTSPIHGKTTDSALSLVMHALALVLSRSLGDCCVVAAIMQKCSRAEDLLPDFTPVDVMSRSWPCFTRCALSLSALCVLYSCRCVGQGARVLSGIGGDKGSTSAPAWPAICCMCARVRAGIFTHGITCPCAYMQAKSRTASMLHTLACSLLLAAAAWPAAHVAADDAIAIPYEVEADGTVPFVDLSGVSELPVTTPSRALLGLTASSKTGSYNYDGHSGSHSSGSKPRYSATRTRSSSSVTCTASASSNSFSASKDAHVTAVAYAVKKGCAAGKFRKKWLEKVRKEFKSKAGFAIAEVRLPGHRAAISNLVTGLLLARALSLVMAGCRLSWQCGIAPRACSLHAQCIDGRLIWQVKFVACQCKLRLHAASCSLAATILHRQASTEQQCGAGVGICSNRVQEQRQCGGLRQGQGRRDRLGQGHLLRQRGRLRAPCHCLVHAALTRCFELCCAVSTARVHGVVLPPSME